MLVTPQNGKMNANIFNKDEVFSANKKWILIKSEKVKIMTESETDTQRDKKIPVRITFLEYL